jgi:hypothetical protein
MAKAISLHIGINQYDKSAYFNRYKIQIGHLPNCCNDARACKGIAERFGYATNVLLDEKATAKNLLSCIERIAQHLQGGDLFFLSFSGHGGQVLDKDGDEQRHQYEGYRADDLDETWCLYDQMVIDDELFDAFGRFRPGVRLLVISDSCYSGTSVKRAIPTDKDIAATGLLMAACQDWQKALAGTVQQKYSNYTQALLHVMQREWPCANYQVLHERITRYMPMYAKPNLFPFGQSAQGFIQSRPFVI